MESHIVCLSQAVGFWINLGIFFPNLWKTDGNTHIFPTHGWEEENRKNKHLKVKSFLNILREAEIHAVARVWDEWILMVREKHGKQVNIKYGKSKHSKIMGS